MSIKKDLFPLEGVSPRPFLKWAGGKQQLLHQFEPFWPRQSGGYLEPFVGSGAVFFHLWNTRRLPKKVTLFDRNEELINVYKVVRDDVDKLINTLASHKKNHGREYYYRIRSLDRQKVVLNNLERAARTIYLNKTCFNGLYRVNSKKQFNVPMGSYTDPPVLQEELLRAASLALQQVRTEVLDFREIVAKARPGDFLYLDPPYEPVSKTASFTNYTSEAFDNDDQRDLASVFSELDRKGCFCMLSNSYTPLILQLYCKYRIEVVWARRAVNSNAAGRGRVREVVVLNY